MAESWAWDWSFEKSLPARRGLGSMVKCVPIEGRGQLRPWARQDQVGTTL